MNRYFIALFFLLWQTFSFGQQNIFAFRNFSEKDGLFSKTVYCIDQDTSGFIWVGTSNGLYRFDGKKFLHFKSPLDGDERRINSILINIKYDKRLNRLWLASTSDLQYFDLNNYKFYSWVKYVPELNKLFSSDFKSILLKDQNDIWIGVRNEIFSYDLKNKTVEPIYNTFNFESDTKKNYARFEQISLDSTYIILPNYVYLIDKEKKIINKHKAGQSDLFQNLYFDADRKTLWIAAFQCLVKINLNNGSLERKHFKYKTDKGVVLNHFIIAISPQDKEHLFLSGMGGLMLYNTTKEEHTLIPYSKGLNENQMSGILHFTDREGNFWRGSYNDFCNVLYHQNAYLKRIFTKNDKTGINIEPYKTVYGGNQKYYLNGSGNSGFGEIDLAKNTVKFYEKDIVFNAVVNDLVYSKNKEIVTCNKANIYTYNFESKKFNPLANKSFGNIEYLFDWNDSILAFTSHQLVYNFNYRTKKEIKLRPFETETGILKPELVHHGRLYYSCMKGIYYQDSPFSNLKFLNLPPAKNTGKRVNNVLKILVDYKGQFWIGTEQNGLFVYNADRMDLINISSENSIMINDVITDLAIDKSNRLWAAALDKFYVFDINTHQCITTYGSNIGLEAIGYNFDIHENGMATFNNYPYINFLDLNKFSSSIAVAPPVVTSIQIGSGKKISFPVTRDTSFKCKYDDAAVFFEFTNLVLNNSESNQYRIKLEGLDTAWTTTTNRSISYARLPPGNYTFLLQASNNNGVWHPKTLKIGIKVIPPFYFQWWFLLFSFLCIGALAFYLYDQKVKRIRNEEQLKSKYEKQLSEVEMKALRAQMNPHFIFNSLNSIQKFIFEKDEYAASQYLTKFSRLIRLILDHSNQDFITVASEIDLLRYYIEMERLRFSNKFEFELIKDFDVKDEWLIPSMVIQPHVENAIWHGLMHKDENCRLKIIFSNVNDASLVVTIEDNGVGREMAQKLRSKQVLKNKSYGSNISKERINHFNQLHGITSSFDIIDLKDDKGIGIGTRVKLGFPFLKNI